MFSAGSSPKAVEEKGNSTLKEQGKKKKKKNKLYWVAKHGKIDIMQRCKAGELRPLNWPKIQKDTERIFDGSAIRHFQIDTRRRTGGSATSPFQNDTIRGPDGSETSPEYFYLKQNKGHHHPMEQLKGIESGTKDSDEDYKYLSSREMAEKLDRVERELVRIKDTKKAFAETTDTLPTNHTPTKERRREVSSLDITAKIDRLERELVRNEGTKKAFAAADTLPTSYHTPTEERTRGVSNHRDPHPPGSQREQRRGQSKNRLGSQYSGSQGLPETGLAEREHRRGESIHSTLSQPESHKSFRERSNHHPGPHIGFAETERAERERIRGRSNVPTSPRPHSRVATSDHPDPPSMSPGAARGPKQKNRRRRGA